MTLREMTELIKQHHPHMREQEIRMLINRASDDFCAKTEMVKTQFTIIGGNATTTIANQRYYKLPDAVIKILGVFMNDVRIPRMIGKPIIDDTTSEETIE